MRRAAFCALALAAALLQVVLIDGLPLPGGAVPDIALVLVVTAGLAQGPVTGMLAGFTAGLCLDLAPPGGYLVGASALIFCLIGYGCGRLSGRPDRSVPGALAVAVIAVCLGEAAQGAVGLIAPGTGVTPGAVLAGLPAAAAYDTALCAVPLIIMAITRARSRIRPAARMNNIYGPYAPRGYATSRTEPAPNVTRVQSPARPAPALLTSEREVRLRLGASAHGRARSMPGGGASSRLPGPGRGRRLRLRPGRGLPHRQPDRPVRVRFRGPWTSRALSMRRLFRRQARIGRRATYGPAGGFR